MATGSGWTRQQLLVAFNLYCRLPFGRLHSRNPEVIGAAEAIGRTPSALAMKLTNIASLDPAITSSGRTGLKGASANDRAMWDEMHGDWQRFAVESQKAVEAIQAAAVPTEKIVDEEPDYPVGQDRLVQATTRIGQSFFRAMILSAYNERCCITGLSIPSLLVASHIVPWSHDQQERVNPRNGLLLSALHDKAFDKGIFTVDDDMTVRISPKYRGGDDRYFSESIERYEGRPVSPPQKFAPDQDLLSYHRTHIFQR